MWDKIPRAKGSPIFMRVLYDTLKGEVPRDLLAVTAIVLLLLLIHFRLVKLIVIAIIPLLSALIATLGMVNLLGIQLDIFSVLAFPLIIGIGIDDGVHIIHHLKNNKTGLGVVFSSVGLAILLTTITTMASFGSLMIADYRGIFRMGVTVFIGVAFCFIFTLLLIPVFVGAQE